MGFLSSLFGKDQRKDAKNAYAESSAMLEAGKTKARAELEGAIGTQRNLLEGGYNTARGDIGRGMTDADAFLAGGYGQARTDVGGGYDRAVNALDPFVASGTRALNQYEQATGVAGADAQRDYYEQYADANNPLTAYRDEQANRALQQQFNARGQSGSGRFNTAVSRASLERRNADVQQQLDRVGRQAELGGQYASRTADLEAARGTTLGNLSASEGTSRGDLAFKGNTALGSLAYGYGSDRSNLEGNNASALANLEYGNAQQNAGNRINLGNSLAATRNMGFNNLLGLGSLAVTGFTPGRYGQSAFGSMGSSMNKLWGSSSPSRSPNGASGGYGNYTY